MPAFDSLALALAYLERHFWERYIFPIKAGAKFPPLLKDNLDRNASNDPKQIAEWAKKFPGCNWGLAHRKSGNLVVDVDCDPKKNKQGQITYDALDLIWGWPDTEITTTPSGGHHHIYKGLPGLPIPMALGKNGLGLDIDVPNYTLLPGCVFKDGTSYVGNDADTVDCPQWVYDTIKNAKSRAKLVDASENVIELDKPENIQIAKDFLLNDAEPAIEGSGGDFNTLKTAMYLKDFGLSIELALDMMDEFYNPRCEPPWERADLEKKVANGYSYSTLSKGGGKTAEAEFADDEDDPFEPMGNKKTIKKQMQERKRAQKTEASRPPSRSVTKQTLISDWVWIGRDERFVLKADTEVMWKKTAFDNMYRNLVKKGEPKSLSEGMLAQTKGTIMKYEGVGFKPGEGVALNDGKLFNLYTPPNLVPAEGDIAWWNEHLEYLFPEPEYRDHVLNWMAWLLQNLAKKPKHALIIQGPEQGTGKSFICWVLRRLVNEKNVSTVSQSSLSGKFNSWALRAKLIVIEELRAVERAEVKQNLHHLITEDVIDVERKGLDVEKAETCFGIFGMTNDDVALMLDITDRRYLIVKTEAKPRSSEYYNALYAKLDDPAAMSAIFYSLMQRDLGAYSGEQAAPATSAKTAMLEAGMSDLEVWLIDHSGEFPLNGRLIAIDDILEILPKNLQSRSSRLYSAIKTILKQKFNSIELGQCPISNGKRPRLYGLKGMPIITNLDQRAIGALYEADKKRAGKGQDIDDAGSELGQAEED